MERESTTEALKNAIIAEVAADVLQIKDDVAELKPLVNQLKESLPQSFDLLKSGMIETLEAINKGILEAGGDRIDFVKGQLHSYIEHAVSKALETNSQGIEDLQNKFARQNALATQNLKTQYEEVSNGMRNVLLSSKKAASPLWLKVTIPLAIIFTAVCSGAVCWQIASYKEAMYMQAFLNQVNSENNKR